MYADLRVINDVTASRLAVPHPAYTNDIENDMDQNFRASEPDIVYDSRVANRASIDAWTSGTSALSNDWPHAVERGRPGDKPWGALIERPVARS